MFAKRFFRNKLSLFGLAIVVVLALVSFLAGYLQPYDPLKISISSRTQAPSKNHTFGTDHFGRDIFSRILSGAKISLTVGIVSVALGAFIGIILGALAGYFGGWVDYGITLIMDAIISFPATLLAIGLMSVMGLGVTNIILALGFIGIPHYGRIMRGAVLSIREKEYVEAAYALGFGPWTIMTKYLLINAITPVLVLSAVQVPRVISLEATLSFLGLGVPVTTPSIGLAIARGYQVLFSGSWWASIFPGLALMLLVACINVVADWLRDALEPRSREQV